MSVKSGKSERDVEVDAVFGALDEKGPNYRAVGWKSTTVLLVKCQIGLGVLSLPSVFQVLGLVPGIICILVVAAITTWTCIVVGQFKLKHPEVYGFGDVGRKLGGRIGEEVASFAFWLFMTFVGGAGMVSLSVSLNAISVHGACTAVFVAVAAIVSALCASIQTLGRIQALGWVGVVSIMSSIIILTIAVGTQDRPSEAPQTGEWHADIVYFGHPSFAAASAAVSSIVLAYAGVAGTFPLISEMRDPRLYPRAVYISQAVATVTYLVIGSVVYYYCGQYVATPALGSAGPLFKRICYGIAIPALLMTTVLYTHFSAKYIFVRLLRGSDHLNRNTLKHWVVWLGSVSSCIIVSYIIASAIPNFGSLVSLIGAFFGSLLCINSMCGMWLYDNWANRDRSFGARLMLAWVIFVALAGFFVTGAGTYGSIVDIVDSYRQSGGSVAWSCADNSNSV